MPAIALTKAQLALCVMMFGAGSVTTNAVTHHKVKKARPPASRSVTAKPAPQVPQTPKPEASAILDCPAMPSVPSSPLDISPLPSVVSPSHSELFGPVVSAGSGGGGGVGGGGTIITPPEVPEPDTWAMLVLGFGFLGLSLRKQKRIVS